MKPSALLSVVALVVGSFGCDEALGPWSQSADATPLGIGDPRADERELTTRLRRELLADEALSVTARAVSITARKGSVTLNGLVLSQDERVRIASHARALAGARTVYDRLEVVSR